MGNRDDGSRDLYLALDQGGHATRALALDGRGRLAAEGRAPIDLHRPRPGWAEHDADELVRSCFDAIAAALQALGGRRGRIVAAGLATQRSNVVCWDRQSGAALSPVISWQDRRAHRWIERFADQFEAIQRVTGLYPTAHYGAGKLRWCLDNLPAVAAAEREGRLAWGPMASFLAFRLLGRRPPVTDPANASRTLLWNHEALDWDPDLLERFDLPREPLPRCVPSLGEFGELRSGETTIPLRLLTGDQPASLFGSGPPREDVLHVNAGTGAFVLRVGSRPPGTGSALLHSVVLQDGESVTYAVEGTVNGAASALRWAEEQLGLSPGDAVSELPRWLAAEPRPPLFLNGVSGLGSPYWVPDFDSRFVGEAGTAGKMVAVLESIVFLLQANIEVIRRLPGPVHRIAIGGGLADQDGLCQRLADLTGLRVERSGVTEMTARGVAFLLAGRAPDPVPGAEFHPAADDGLRERYRRWKAALEAALPST